MQKAMYQLAFWISATEKTRTEDLRKHNLSHHDIYVMGLELAESNTAQKPVEKKKSKEIK